MIKRLGELDMYCDMERVMKMDFDEQLRSSAPTTRGREPLFYVSISLYDKKDIP